MDSIRFRDSNKSFHEIELQLRMKDAHFQLFPELQQYASIPANDYYPRRDLSSKFPFMTCQAKRYSTAFSGIAIVIGSDIKFEGFFHCLSHSCFCENYVGQHHEKCSALDAGLTCSVAPYGSQAQDKVPGVLLDELGESK